MEDLGNYIRKFIVRANHLDELVDLGTLTAPAASFLDACVVAGLNVLVAGGTQAGKTTIVGRAIRHRCLGYGVRTRFNVDTGQARCVGMGGPCEAGNAQVRAQ